MELRVRFSSIAAVILLTACTTTTAPTATPPAATPASELARFIDEATAQSPFDRAIWGIHVEEDDGTVLYSRNARTLLQPASNRKLFAAATIANCLGVDTRLSTELFLDDGELVVRGDGDPSLGSWRYAREDDFDAVAKALEARGITRVRNVVADVSLFADRVTIPGSWKVGNLPSDYAAPVDALAWGENEVPTDRSVPDAALHAAGALRSALFNRGIAADGVRVETAPRQWREPIATLPSPFVGHLLATVLKNSHNLYTEMLFKRASRGTYAGSFALERQLLVNEIGAQGVDFRFVDGSGLSPDDLVAPAATIAMLRWMNHPARRPLWWSLLATPNQEGTLRRRVIALEQRLRGKTGTIAGVAALSGVIAMPNDRWRYFVVVVNHHAGDGDDAVKIIDSIVTRIAGAVSSTGPAPR